MSRHRAAARLLLVLVGLAGVVGAAYVAQDHLRYPEVAGVRERVVYVDPAGMDTVGRGSARSPWQTIGYALQYAQPGTTIFVKAGTYPEFITSVRDGAPNKPITLQAVGRVVVTGRAGKGRIMELHHDYHVVRGFEFTGRDIHLWLQEADHVTIAHNYFHGAQGECVRLKYQSSHNIFEHNRVETCGQEDFGGGGEGKNGEGVYIGTAPEQLDRNPTADIDRSNYNIIRHNTFNTRGNECVDIKEGAEYNVSEYNTCTGQLDPESGGMDSRGNNNIFRYNRIFGNKGAGVRLGGDTAVDGVKNSVYGNTMTGNDGVALKVMRQPQGRICGNTAHNNARGWSNVRALAPEPCAFPLASPR